MRSLLALTVGAFLCAAAQADIGESRKDLDARYVQYRPPEDDAPFGKWSPYNHCYYYHQWWIGIHFNKQGIAVRALYGLHQGHNELTDDDLHWVLRANGVDPRVADWATLKDFAMLDAEGRYTSETLYRQFDSAYGKIWVKVEWVLGLSDNLGNPIAKSHGQGADLPISIDVWFAQSPAEQKYIETVNFNKMESLRYENALYESTKNSSGKPIPQLNLRPVPEFQFYDEDK